MKTNTPLIRSYLVMLVLALSLTGCGGGDAVTQTTNKSTTTGQELIDLDKAHKQGIISDKEYEEAREKILEGE
jgi:hypothetical protein